MAASSSEAHLTEATCEAWPLAKPFVIARGTKTEAHVIVAHVAAGHASGRGEAVPYARYGETVEAALKELRALSGPLSRARIGELLPAGAARNALDCALWDLEAKLTGKRAWTLAGMAAPLPAMTCFTISLGDPAQMATDAKAVRHLKLLKLKLGGDGDDARMLAVREARPDARIVADANEAWGLAQLEPFLAAAAAAAVELIEQPLPAGADEALSQIARPVPVCADESAHTSADLAALTSRYDAVNIKLDKTGGLTEALAMAEAAKAKGFKIMVGSMVGTSLAAAPAMLLAGYADWVDLDGPLLLARDREPPLNIIDGWIEAPPADLWG
ncbi:MAG: N-acetyl-D-Glu racemase DgcA [Hyphomicrobium sp.]|jgi:L-alanine-DL-glutamate epimerase-like enolase superfamily enzyme